MKVLHIIGGGDVGGAKTHVLSLIKELGQNLEVKLIALRPGPFAEEARSMGIDVEVIRSGNIFSDINKIVSLINSGSYDIIHSHGAKANLISAVAKRKTHRVTITTIHSDYRLDYMRSLTKRLSFGVINTIAIRFLDYFECVSRNFRDMLVDRNFDPGRIFVINNGVDFRIPVTPYPRQELIKKYKLPINEDDIIIGILARMDPVKGLGTLIDAAALVTAGNPSVKFIIAGDGPERKNLEKKVKELGLTGKVLFPGWINKPEEFLSNFDVNVLTSYTEGFPYVILEGTRYAKATVSSDVGGIADLMESGYNGYLFTAGDHKKLAEQLLKLAADPELRRTMGKRIQEKAEEYFSLEKMCSTQLEIYDAILAENASHPTKTSYDVIISGYYGFENIGDDAMLLAIINNLKACKKDLKILVLSKNASKTAKAFNIAAMNRISFISIYRAMKKAKLFLYGGGNIIQDNTSTRSLLYYLGTIWLAKRLGIKVMFYANGIGPLNRKINQRLTRKIVNQIDVITLREDLSGKELEKLEIVKPRIHITSDPALTLNASGGTEIEDIFRKEGIDTEGPFIGFSVRKKEGHEKYTGVIAGIADYVYEKYGLKPVFIPMQNPEDRNIMEQIISKMKYPGYLLKNRYSVAQTFGIIKRMEMIVGMRLHSLIFAATLGVPLIGLVYQPKVEAFLRCINQDRASAGNAASLDYERLKQLVDYTWETKDSMKEELKNATAGLKARALKNAEIAVELIEETTQR